MDHKCWTEILLYILVQNYNMSRKKLFLYVPGQTVFLYEPYILQNEEIILNGSLQSKVFR